ncbi:hypothetical protein ACFWGD_03565 [Corynebacterium sp. NPDC060344]|uniref:hypothetical protein n=1 Tax=Corynebacterium sp. NPDC060344 TaxID=3347101 RepID=UPI00365563B0
MAATITDDAPARTIGRGRGRGRIDTPAAPAPARRGKGRRTIHRGRTGSRQIVSRRGRRLTNTTADRSKVRFAIGSILVVVLGIVLAMVLSGLSTSQSFQLNEARQEEQRLRDGISVLERDVEFQRSTAEIARRAAEMGMVNVENPAILVVGEDGAVHEVRPGSPEHQRVVDVNGAAVRPDAPTSNPAETEHVPGMQAPSVQEANPAVPQLPAQAPYAPGAARQQAPAPAPAPGPAPAPAPAPEGDVNPGEVPGPAVD